MINLSQDDVMRNWSGSLEQPLVSIDCITYNHEKYISETLDGFFLQKTTFPFEILVHDDASTDKTAEIIRTYEKKYPLIIKPIYQKENQWSKHIGSISEKYNFPRAKGSYIAFCEGDDYWTDENKLQLQVDFLEQNPDYGMCYTQAKSFLECEKKFLKTPFGLPVESFEDFLKNGNRIPTLTVCVRRDLINQYISAVQPHKQKWLLGDYPMWLYVAYKSKLFFIQKKTGIYRILQDSASHSIDVEKQYNFAKSVYDVRKFYSELSGIPIENWDEERNRFLLNCQLMKKYVDDESFRKNVQNLYGRLETKNLRTFVNYFISKNKFLLRLFVFTRRLIGAYRE